MIVAELLAYPGSGETNPIHRLGEFHEEVVRAIRANYPINEVPPDLVGHLRFLGDQVRDLQSRYGEFLARELPPARSEVAA